MKGSFSLEKERDNGDGLLVMPLQQQEAILYYEDDINLVR